MKVCGDSEKKETKGTFKGKGKKKNKVKQWGEGGGIKRRIGRDLTGVNRQEIRGSS